MQTQETAKDDTAAAGQEPVVRSKSILYTLKNITPARLGFLLFFICGLSSVFCIVAVSIIQQHEQAVKTVGVDSAPSVIAAYEIKSGLLAMDRDLSSQLLYKPDAAEGQDMEKHFEMWRIATCRQLVAAAKNITYPGELVPIENIQIALGKFVMQAQKARDVHEAGKPGEAVLAYRDALGTLNRDLFPNVQALEKEDTLFLEDTYNHEKSASNLSRGFLLVLGLVLLSALLYTWLFLLTRFHRRLCPPLILSALCLIALLHQLTNSLTVNSNYLKVAKEDSYDSVLALLVARAYAYEACALANRRLLDTEHADEYQKEFSEKISKIASFEGSHNIEETIQTAQKQLAKHEKLNLQGFSGALADELSNACFEREGEPTLALDTLKEFAEYCQAERKVLELDESGSHDEAVRMCLSYNPSGSKYPFTEFDEALVRTLKVNQAQLEESIRGAVKSLSALVAATEIVCLLIVICIYVGLTPRMDEYVRCGPKL